MKKIKIFLCLVTIIFVFSYENALASDFQFVYNIISSTESSTCVYNNEICYITPFFNTNINGLQLVSLKIENNYETRIINISDCNAYINFSGLKNQHYELDDLGNVYFVARDEEYNVYLKNLSTNNISFVNVYKYKNVPNWVDGIYSKNEIFETLDNNNIINYETVIIDDTMYLITNNENANEFTFINTKTNEVSLSKYTKDVKSYIKSVKKFNFYGNEVELFTFNKRYVLLDKGMMDKIYNEEILNYSYIYTNDEFFNFIDSYSFDTIKNAFKHYKQYNDIDNKKTFENCKEKIKKKDKDKYEKIEFNIKKDNLVIIDNKLYITKTKDEIAYRIKITEKDLNENKKIGYIKKIKKVLQYCEDVIGAKYSQDKRTDTPNYYDCSSLVYYAYNCIEIELGEKKYPPTAAYEAWWLNENNKLKKVNSENIKVDDLQPGDLLFYSSKVNGRYKNITHVAMYIGDGNIIHAANIKKGVCKEEVYFENIVAYGQP